MPSITPSSSMSTDPVVLPLKSKRILQGVLGLALVSRLFANAAVPLLDHTESRYGEMARKMLETGDWLWPRYAYEVPFWGKPPLSFWAEAASMACFGVNEFAARLPALLFEIGILWLVHALVKRRRGPGAALLSVAVLATMAQFLMAAGTVMTDPVLAFCTTLALVSFWMAMDGAGRVWRWMFFAGIGLGLLAKGPLVLVLVFLPLVPWIAWTKRWMQAWRDLPWVAGGILALAIAAPWYILAELRTPGFLEYFLVGEHFYRFVKPGWEGDMYGHAHNVPPGTIWFFWATAALPWSLAAAWACLRDPRRWRACGGDPGGFVSYAAAWAVAAACFFTFARNIIWPYCLPLLPAVAVLVVEAFARFGRPRDRHLAWMGAAIPAIFLAFAAFAWSEPALLSSKSDKEAVRTCLAAAKPEDGIWILGRRSYSADFYSAGRVKLLEAVDDRAVRYCASKPLLREGDPSRRVQRERVSWNDLLADGRTDYILVLAEDLGKIPEGVRGRLAEVRRFGRLDAGSVAADLKAGRNPLGAGGSCEGFRWPQRDAVVVLRKDP